MLHCMDVALQFDFNGLKLGPDLLNVVLQFSLDGLMFIFQVEFQFPERLPVGGLVLLELVFQSEFQFLKGLSVGSFMFLKLMLQGGLNLLKVVFQGEFQRLEVWLGGEVFITAGVPPGDDFGLGASPLRSGA